MVTLLNAAETFVYDTYTKFITIVNKAIKNQDPNHLNLGLRFGGNPPDDLVKASASIGFDVFSLNIYGYSAYPDRLKKIDELTGLPIIIGEFHFGTPGTGTFTRFEANHQPGRTGSGLPVLC